MVIIALIGLIGVLLGAILQALLSRANAKNSFTRQKKTDAYLLFFEGMAEVSHSKNPDELLIGRKKIAQARSLCVLYADDTVLESLTEVLQEEDESVDQSKAKTQMLRTMRNDTLSKRTYVSDANLYGIVFGHSD